MSHPDGTGRARARDEERESAISLPPGLPSGVTEVRSQHLMGGQREIIILHGGDRYRLRITANDKLILTK